MASLILDPDEDVVFFSPDLEVRREHSWITYPADDARDLFGIPNGFTACERCGAVRNDSPLQEP